MNHGKALWQPIMASSSPPRASAWVVDSILKSSNRVFVELRRWTYLLRYRKKDRMNRNVQKYAQQWDLVIEKEVKTLSSTVCFGRQGSVPIVLKLPKLIPMKYGKKKFSSTLMATEPFACSIPMVRRCYWSV